MLTIKQLRDDREAAIRRLAKKGVDAAPVIAEIEKLDDRRKAIQHELDSGWHPYLCVYWPKIPKCRFV